jgi:hypothetical protein
MGDKAQTDLELQSLVSGYSYHVRGTEPNFWICVGNIQEKKAFM